MAKEYDIKKLKELIQNRNIAELKQFMKDNDLIIDGNMIVSKDAKEFAKQMDFFDKKQYIKKLELNSSYGAILNNACVFFDFRMGSSTTMSGRKVWQHLSSSANNAMVGKYEINGSCQFYGDTDSCYMSIDNDEFRQVHPDFDYSKDHLVQYADEIADKINDSFPTYMEKAFHCQGEAKEIEKAGREVVATAGLFVAKKRYSLMMIDKDGWRLDTNGKPGKIKNMGLQTQRSDSPLMIRKLLKKMLESLLINGSKEELLSLVRDFANNEWQKLKPWEKGRPKACNNLTQYYNEWATSKKCAVGQAMAAINWNIMIDIHKDKKTPKILDGNKVIVCTLMPHNPFGMKSIAYPVDLTRLPKWFKELPFDEQSMKDTIVDKTIETVFGVLNWKLTIENALNQDCDLDGFLTYE